MTSFQIEAFVFDNLNIVVAMNHTRIVVIVLERIGYCILFLLGWWYRVIFSAQHVFGDVKQEKALVNLLLEDLRTTHESSEPFKTITQVSS